MYICLVHSFCSFLHRQLRPASKDSLFHGDLLTLPIDSVARPWLSLWHVLEVSVFIGHTALLGVWPLRPNIWLGKSRELPQGPPVSKFPRFLVPPGAQYSSGTPQEKSRGGEIRRTWWLAHWGAWGDERPLQRGSQASLLRDVRVWAAGPSSWNDCWLSVSAFLNL